MTNETTWRAVDSAARPYGLAVLTGTRAVWDSAERTVLLLTLVDGGWERFCAAPEAGDGAPDPLDRWSRRMAEAVAPGFAASVVMPSDGPPYAPFVTWALASPGVWGSPIGMMVHAERGLMMSIRAALIVSTDIAPPEIRQNLSHPCDSCAASCLTTCPAKAFEGGQYAPDVCAAWLRSDAGISCADGCLARRVCPLSSGVSSHQQRFHLAAFLRNR